MRNNKGFTLIELLVVIAIIGLLATVVMVSLNSAREKGRDTRKVEDINRLRTALEMYYDSNGQYPANLDALSTAGFLSVVPKDPQGNDYNYSVASGNLDYVLYTTLEQGTHPALNSDVDGATVAPGNVNCNDPVYCVKP